MCRAPEPGLQAWAFPKLREARAVPKRESAPKMCRCAAPKQAATWTSALFSSKRRRAFGEKSLRLAEAARRWRYLKRARLRPQPRSRAAGAPIRTRLRRRRVAVRLRASTRDGLRSSEIGASKNAPVRARWAHPWALARRHPENRRRPIPAIRQLLATEPSEAPFAPHCFGPGLPPDLGRARAKPRAKVPIQPMRKATGRGATTGRALGSRAGSQKRT